MATVYSVAFVSAVLDDTTPDVEFICPAGFVAVLRCVDVYSADIILPQNIHLEERPSGLIWWVTTATEPPLSQHAQWRGRQVMEEDVGFAIVAEEGTWGVRASGYLLTAP